ncbi:MAG: exodeoxyribonuclease VII small subunit [Elusimicrobiota bacterium]
MENKENDLNFEQAFKELEKITSKLSQGNLSLEESIKLFERGMKLKDFCAKRLNQARNKIKILVEKQGEYKEEDFEHEE